MADQQSMTKKQVTLAKKKVALLEKFGMNQSANKLKEKMDISYDTHKVDKLGYKQINVEDNTLIDRLCPERVSGRQTVIIGQETVGLFNNRTKDITEEREVKRRDELNNCTLSEWGGEIPLSVLNKISKAKKDGFTNFVVYYPQEQGSSPYTFTSCNDPVVVGYISQNRWKNCPNISGSPYGSQQPCYDQRICKRDHWTFYPIGPAFEIGAWEQCDIDKEGI